MQMQSIKNKMRARTEVHSRDNGYRKLRRNALMSMGFCPDCLEGLDTFPAQICTECKEVKQFKFHNRKNGLQTTS